MVTLRRFALLVALSVWQGGFFFYAAVVVPIGTDELHSALRQGFITRRVTDNINAAGVVALLFVAWDAWSARDPSRPRRLARLALLLLMTLAQVGLFYLHPRMDAMMVRKGFLLLDPEAFRPLHRLYLWLQTVAWAAAVFFLLLSLFGWREEDLERKVGDAGSPGKI